MHGERGKKGMISVPKRNAYLARRDAIEQQIWDAAQSTFVQYMADLFTLTLNDSQFMGKDTFGAARIKAVIEGVKHYDGLYHEALETKAESDYLRETLDKNLLRILRNGPEFVPFRKRYPWLKEIRYRKK